MKPVKIKTPGGEELLLITRADYEAALEARDVALYDLAMAKAAATGSESLLDESEVLALLDAPTPLAFWRKKRGLTQGALAEATGISQSYLASLETGKREGSPVLFLRLARALHVRMEDLVEDTPDTSPEQTVAVA